MIDLTYYLLTKTDGKSWQGDPAVERLVEARTVSKIFGFSIGTSILRTLVAY